MTAEQDNDPMEVDEYDEEADSDFDEQQTPEDGNSSDSDEEADGPVNRKTPRNEAKKKQTESEPAIELDSGDEATIKEQEKIRRRQRRKGQNVEGDSGDDSEGWRAKTRAMRQRDQVEKKKNRLATSKGSTIDVDKIWEEMNRPGPLPPVRIEGAEPPAPNPAPTSPGKESVSEPKGKVDAEEMITIKRRFKFAGEVHVEEKTVPKSSAEAALWLAQQGNKSQPQSDVENNTPVQRPLRKISRFDPNYNNLSAYKTSWIRAGNDGTEQFKGPKLNVVEKSKMDWAVHVDAEGLKDELDVHAKAKEGYHSRMEFLQNVEQRKEEEARLARAKK